MRRMQRGKRGAAMVEAAVVIPVMIAFLGLTMMMKNAYTAKLTKNQQVRSQVLDYASHQCNSNRISYSGTSQGQGGSSVGGVNPGQANANDALAASGPASQSVSGFMGKAQVTYGGMTVVNPKPNTATRGMGLTLRVNGETSSALCNETPRDGSFSGMFGYIKDQITSFAR